MIIMSWDYIEATLLIFAVDSCGMLVFVALKALYEIAIFVIKLIIFKLALKE